MKTCSGCIISEKKRCFVPSIDWIRSLTLSEPRLPNALHPHPAELVYKARILTFSGDSFLLGTPLPINLGLPLDSAVTHNKGEIITNLCQLNACLSGAVRKHK